MGYRNAKLNTAFTLIEVTIVVFVMSLLAVAALRYQTIKTVSNNVRALNATLDTVETALLNYRTENGRLPCPAALASAENTAAFGQEVDSTGDGNCNGVDFTNSGTDPDASDPSYDSATASKIVAGAVPTKALRLADSYAYDPWGRKILYTVDKRITATAAFTTYPVNSPISGPSSAGASVVGGIVVKKTATDTLANAYTYKAIYALVSFGKNGHGGYVRNVSATSTPFNAGSNNTDELKNCHCANNASNSVFDRIFVQKILTTDYLNLTDSFDDIVRFKNRQQMTISSETQ